MKRTILLGIVLIFTGLVSILLLYNPLIQKIIRKANLQDYQTTAPAQNLRKENIDNQAGKIITKEFRKTYTKKEINSITYPFYAQSNQYIQSQYDIDHYTITYNSTDERAVLFVNTAQLYIPKTSGATFPVYVFGPGTTGLDDQCAPSKENVARQNWGDYRAHTLSYAGQGYIVIMPDYEGFNDGPERIHHYFIAQLEAHVLLDGARAVYDFFTDTNNQVKPQQAVFFAGYSQGGHAAFAAKDNVPDYAPELPVKGVIGYGATTNIIALLKEASYLGPYLLVAYQDYYHSPALRPERFIQPQWLPTLFLDTRTKCIGDIGEYYRNGMKRVYTPEFAQALNDDMQNYKDAEAYFNQNNTGYRGNDIPALIVQGSTDPIVTVESQDKFITDSCRAGNMITYNLYPGVHHYQSRQVSFHDSLEWMHERIEGKQVTDSCPQFSG